MVVKAVLESVQLLVEDVLDALVVVLVAVVDAIQDVLQVVKELVLMAVATIVQENVQLHAADVPVAQDVQVIVKGNVQVDVVQIVLVAQEIVKEIAKVHVIQHVPLTVMGRVL